MKRFSKLMAGLLAIALLTGCTSGKPTNTDTTKEDSKKEPITLTMWVANKDTDEFTKNKIKEFEDKNPNIKLNLVVHEGDAGNDFFQAVAAGNAPDFVEVSLANITKYAGAGILAPMDEYFKGWSEANKYDEKYIDQFTFGDKLMAIPTQGTTYYLAYNKKLFKEAGITEPPKTWAEMLEVAKKLTKSDKSQWGYNMLAAEWTEWFFEYYVWQAGGDLTKKNADGTMELTFTDPAVVEAAKYYQDLRKADVTQSDLTMKFGDLVKAFADGKAAMMIFATDWVKDVSALGMKAEDIGLAMPPVGPSGQPTIFGGIGGGFVINGKAPKANQDAAFEFLKFRASADYYSQWYQDQAKKGPIGPYMLGTTDFDLSKYVDLDANWVKITNDMKPYMRDEFYGKGTVGKYIDKAVQKIILDPNCDVEKELQAAQEQATKEVLDDFNAKAKAGN